MAWTLETTSSALADLTRSIMNGSIFSVDSTSSDVINSPMA